MDSAVNVALVVPLHGSAGIFGPSCELCAQLAVAEINAADGVLGRSSAERHRRLRCPAAVADEVGALVAAGRGRRRRRLAHLAGAPGRRPARRAASSRTSTPRSTRAASARPGVFLDRRGPVAPAAAGDASASPASTGCGAGRSSATTTCGRACTARAARRYARAARGEICHEAFLPLGTATGADVEAVERLARRRGPDAAGRRGRGHLQPRVRRAPGLDRVCRRLSTLIDENTLPARGAENTRGICAAAAYFETLATPESLDFGWRYTRRFGLDAPTLNSVGESCYEGICCSRRSHAAPAASTCAR